MACVQDLVDSRYVYYEHIYFEIIVYAYTYTYHEQSEQADTTVRTGQTIVYAGPLLDCLALVCLTDTVTFSPQQLPPPSSFRQPIHKRKNGVGKGNFFICCRGRRNDDFFRAFMSSFMASQSS
jgi:hypothetical protein